MGGFLHCARVTLKLKTFQSSRNDVNIPRQKICQATAEQQPYIDPGPETCHRGLWCITDAQVIGQPHECVASLVEECFFDSLVPEFSNSPYCP